MPKCEKCGHDPKDRFTAPVRTASDGELRNPDYLRGLIQAVLTKEVPRRAWRDLLADMIRDHSERLRNADGSRLDPPEIDAHFPEDADDRWISGFFCITRTVAVVRIQERVIERVRLIDLYFRVYHPGIAATFGATSPANDNHPLGSDKHAG
jgi:hypothetical protein